MITTEVRTGIANAAAAPGGDLMFAVLPVRSAERLVTLSMMVAASATDEDVARLPTVAHRYMSALVEHLTAWGRSMCDGPDGLLWATVQLGLLVDARRVIESARDGIADSRRARHLVDFTERYSGIVRKHIAAAGTEDIEGR